MVNLQLMLTVSLHRGTDSFDIKGCAISGDRLIFADKRNKRLIVHGLNGNHLDDVKLSAEPFGLVVIDGNNLAVSYGREKYMEIINMETKAVSHKVTMADNCWGLAYDGDNLYVIVDGHGISVKVFTTSGEFVKRIPVRSDFDQAEYITVSNENIFFTVFINQNLVCCDMEGAVKWEFKERTVSQPRGLTADSQGNIFAVGFSSHQLVRVTQDCHENEVFENLKELEYPTAVYCDQQTNRLLVSNLKNGLAFLYDINYQ